MVARIRLLNCQKRLSHSFRRTARMYLGDLPVHLKEYSREYYRELKSYKKITFKNKILDEALRSQIILCGDYHSSSQAQRTVLRILREILPRVKKQRKTLYLGLEILRAEDNIRAQQFTRSEISEAQFLKSIEFQRWGFNWENYAPLIELAKTWNMPLFGLSPKKMGSLQSRDVFAAKMISNWAIQDPNSVVFCLMGDLHLAENHLPKEIKTELKAKEIPKRILTIHQNHDALYWKLVQKKKEDKAQVVQLKKDVFCILNTAPWIKLQSHLNWVEENPDNDESYEPSETIVQLMDGIAYFLNLKRKQLGNGSDIDVRESSDSRTYFSYRDRVFYVGSDNLNHLAKATSQYIHFKLSGYVGEFEKPDRDFYPIIWSEVLGYLGSKIINPKRKCQGIKDFKSSSEPHHVLAYQHIQNQLMFERRKNYSPSEIELFHQVAQLLGKLLGEAIFELILKNKVSLPVLRHLFETPFGAESRSLYFEWCQKADAFSFRHFSYRDKL